MASPTTKKQRISMSEAKETLNRSGYLLEVRLAEKLENAGYYVEANAAYPDTITGKSREFDIFALGAHKLSRRNYDFIFPALLIECINNPQPLALLTKDPQIGFTFHEDMKLAGLPAKILINKKSDEWVSVQEFVNMSKFLHFCKGRVATQFCSFSETKEKKWIALHEGSHFDAFQKICDATAYHVGEQFKSYQPTEDDSINIEFYYPIIVIQGDLLEARTSRKNVSLKKAHHLAYRRTTIQGKKEETYNIDVVTERFFPEYLKIIEDEMKKTAKRIQSRKKEFRKSIQVIARMTKRLKSPEKIKKMMEF